MRSLRRSCAGMARSEYKGGWIETISGESGATATLADGAIRQMPVTLTTAPPNGAVPLPTTRTVRPAMKTGSRCRAMFTFGGMKLFGKAGSFGILICNSRERYRAALTVRCRK